MNTVSLDISTQITKQNEVRGAKKMYRESQKVDCTSLQSHDFGTPAVLVRGLDRTELCG